MKKKQASREKHEMTKNKLEKNTEKNIPVVKAYSGAKKIKRSSPELHGQSNILQNLGPNWAKLGQIFQG